MDFRISEHAAASARARLLSVVVPVYNESAVLPAFHRRLRAALQPWHDRLEVVYVDDGSTDASAAVLKALRVGDASVALLRLSRNFGKEIALSAGLQAANGDAVIVIDADLQDPPELIPAMLERWEQGADIVSMRRRRRDGESWLKKTTAHFYYRTLNRLSDVDIPEDVGDFRLLSRRAVDALNGLPERNRYMKGLFAWVGFGQATIDYDRGPRAAGCTKLNYRRLWSLAAEGVTSFSVKPLRIASLLGVLASGGAVAMTLFYVVKTLLRGETVQGFWTLIVAILLLGGLQLLCIGVLGEYLGRMYMETKRRPLYLQQEFLPAPNADTRFAAEGALR